MLLQDKDLTILYTNYDSVMHNMQQKSVAETVKGGKSPMQEDKKGASNSNQVNLVADDEQKLKMLLNSSKCHIWKVRVPSPDNLSPLTFEPCLLSS